MSVLSTWKPYGEPQMLFLNALSSQMHSPLCVLKLGVEGSGVPANEEEEQVVSHCHCFTATVLLPLSHCHYLAALTHSQTGLLHFAVSPCCLTVMLCCLPVFSRCRVMQCCLTMLECRRIREQSRRVRVEPDAGGVLK